MQEHTIRIWDTGHIKSISFDGRHLLALVLLKKMIAHGC